MPFDDSTTINSRPLSHLAFAMAIMDELFGPGWHPDAVLREHLRKLLETGRTARGIRKSEKRSPNVNLSFHPGENYTIDQAAEILGMSRSHVEKRVQDGRIAKQNRPAGATMLISGTEMIRFTTKGPRDAVGVKVNED
jgi:excisionase family DNA binding protein